MNYYYVSIYSLYVWSENFMESDSMSESQSMTNSLPRDIEKSNSKGIRMAVAFDPSAGPAEQETSKVINTLIFLFIIYIIACVFF